MFFFFKQKTAYEMRISDWSSDVCSSDLRLHELGDLTDDFIRASLRQSRVSLFIAGLAVRAGIDFATSWLIISDPGADSAVVLLRAIDMPRDIAASILMLMQRLQIGRASCRERVCQYV